MSRKDYILIAKAIRAVAEMWKPESKYACAISEVAYNLADKLANDNSRFNHDRFIKACMPE